MHWAISYLDDDGYEPGYYVAKVDEQGYAVYTHPLRFPSEREALRGAARLNVRDEEGDV